jgi:hypothetical protein
VIEVESAKVRKRILHPILAGNLTFNLCCQRDSVRSRRPLVFVIVVCLGTKASLVWFVPAAIWPFPFVEPSFPGESQDPPNSLPPGTLASYEGEGGRSEASSGRPQKPSSYRCFIVCLLIWCPQRSIRICHL